MNKLIALFVFVVSLFSAVNIYAQQWSAEQKEVWKSIETYTELSSTRNAAFINYFDDSYKGWDYDSDAPDGKEEVKIVISHHSDNKILFQIIKPASIWVNGNFAFAHYYYEVTFENKDGKREFEKGRWTDILMKKDGKWIMVGDHGGKISK